MTAAMMLRVVVVVVAAAAAIVPFQIRLPPTGAFFPCPECHIERLYLHCYPL